MVIDAMILGAILLALMLLIARHWPRPVMVVPPPLPVKHPCGFAPPA
jgi:hypothetical protein